MDYRAITLLISNQTSSIHLPLLNSLNYADFKLLNNAILSQVTYKSHSRITHGV